METQTLREVFDKIAPSWYNFRHWSLFPEELGKMAERWKGGKLLNIGCAHGADFLPFKEGFELWGIDFSPRMLDFATKYSQKFNFGVNLILADATSLPFRDNSFDWAIAVATYHHIKGEREREKAFLELWRVLKPGGEAFITVWNRNQRRFWFKPKDIFIPWRAKEGTLYRYYHPFSSGELKKPLNKANFKIEKVFPEFSYRLPIKSFSKNICTLVKK
jgi:ubiquinone/menaquinone biosynthesis C-methylase UbiE